MDTYPEPGVPGLYRWATRRHPYVEVELDGEIFHARAQAWKGDMIMIAKPVGQLHRVENCGSETLWVPAVACRRIRREDSTWISTEDDHDWHVEQDKTIDYRPRIVRD